MSTPPTHAPHNAFRFKVKLGVVAGVMLTIALALLFQTWRLGQPNELPTAHGGKLDCASYTPSHNGRTLDRAAIRVLVKRDLQQLAKRFRCVRTYSVSEGLDEVPRIARELGLKVMLGLWISMDAPSNEREIAHGIEIANQYADAVEAIVVGNEVLLRRELTAKQLGELIAKVRSGTTVPVTYADVWEFWLRNVELADAVNFITIHILPYWEDNPIAIDRALDHVQNIYSKVQGTFPTMRVFIGETGWPSAGRPRLNAIPSLINEARFIREFAAYADEAHISYNFIEAYDQPWKRIQEGTVGGYWGLYDADGEAKFEFDGPVVAEPHWRIAVWMSLGGVALFGALGALLRPRPSTRAIAFMGIVGHAAGSILFHQWIYMSAANRNELEWFATAMWSLIGWLCVVTVTIAIARSMEGRDASRPLGFADFTHALRHTPSTTDRMTSVLGASRFVFLCCLAYVCLGLTFEGRGRDFPIAHMSLPIVLFAALELVTLAPKRSRLDREESLLACVLIGTAAYIGFNESLANSRALAWCGLSAMFGFVVLASQWNALHPRQRAEQETDPA